jgi:hypothetical protein
MPTQLPLLALPYPRTGVYVDVTGSGSSYTFDLTASPITRTAAGGEAGEPHTPLCHYEAFTGGRFYARILDESRPTGVSWMLSTTFLAVTKAV